MGVLAGAALAAPNLVGKDWSMFQELLDASMKDKKGVMIFMGGQSIAGVVVKINGESVELRSREYSRIIVKSEAITAVALS
jgi:hypothetical protein